METLEVQSIFRIITWMKKYKWSFLITRIKTFSSPNPFQPCKKMSLWISFAYVSMFMATQVFFMCLPNFHVSFKISCRLSFLFKKYIKISVQFFFAFAFATVTFGKNVPLLKLPCPYSKLFVFIWTNLLTCFACHFTWNNIYHSSQCLQTFWYLFYC